MKTKDELRQFMADAIPELMREHPETFLAALAGNTEAMRGFLKEAGFSITERNSADPEEMLGLRQEAIRFGRVDGGFGAQLRSAAEWVRDEDPITGRTVRNYLFGEREKLAEAWLRAFMHRSNVDQVSGKNIMTLHAELERFSKRAPSDPLLGDIGGAAGALVPTVIAAQIFEEMNEMFVLKGLVNVFTSGGALDIPRRIVEVTVSRGGTATDISEDKPETGAIHLSHQRVGVITYVDPRLAAASAVGPVRWTLGQIAEAIAKDDQRVIIAGSESSNEPRGISNLPTAGGNTYDRAKTAAYDNTSVVTERASMKEAFYGVSQGHRSKDSFVWVGNNDALRELTTHNDNDQRPWDEAGERYLRKRFVESSALSTAASATTIIGGDFSQYAWLEHPLGLRLEVSDIGGEAWASDTVGVKAVQYVDGAPIIPPAFTKVTSVDV